METVSGLPTSWTMLLASCAPLMEPRWVFFQPALIRLAWPLMVKTFGWRTRAMRNTVTKLRASDGALLGTFAVGENPVGVAFDGTSVWVANSNSNSRA